ncbi:MAG: hypothetical protein ABI823_02220 [Bryobacteraceae bacterium]
MKTNLIVGAVLFVVGFLGGFVPQYSKASKADGEVQDLKQQLDASRRASAIHSFQNRMGLLYVEAARSNFSVASERASKDFTDLRSFENQTSDANLKSALEDILNSRDAVIAGLAKADPAVAASIQGLYLKMQALKP